MIISKFEDIFAIMKLILTEERRGQGRIAGRQFRLIINFADA